MRHVLLLMFPFVLVGCSVTNFKLTGMISCTNGDALQGYIIGISGPDIKEGAIPSAITNKRGEFCIKGYLLNNTGVGYLEVVRARNRTPIAYYLSKVRVDLRKGINNIESHILVSPQIELQYDGKIASWIDTSKIESKYQMVVKTDIEFLPNGLLGEKLAFLVNNIHEHNFELGTIPNLEIVLGTNEINMLKTNQPNIKYFASIDKDMKYTILVRSYIYDKDNDQIIRLSESNKLDY